MITVILSHPIPPVSESVARHFTIISSQILLKGSPFATARRVKSTTCCDDRQSQIPVIVVRTMLEDDCMIIVKRTITSEDQKFFLAINGVCYDFGVCGDDLMQSIEGSVLLEFKIANRS